MSKKAQRVIFPNYDELMELCKENLYTLRTTDEDEVNKIYDMIKEKMYSPDQIIRHINYLSTLNLRYIKSYYLIFKKLYNEYHPRQAKTIIPILDYFYYKEFGVVLNEIHRDSFDYFKDVTFNVHEDSPIYRAIIEDNKKNFIIFSQHDSFDPEKRLKSLLYPKSEEGYSFIELCCLHGAVNCFKYLITEYDSNITPKCLQFSFLSGNPEIMSTCLKYQQPDKECMKCAIISHNIDFVSFLVNEHKIEIDLASCSKYCNVQAFLLYYTLSKDTDGCFVYSPSFMSLPLCEFFIKKVVNINKKCKDNCGILNIASANNFKEVVNILLEKKIFTNMKDSAGNSCLHNAVLSDSNECVEILLSHGMKPRIQRENGETPLHCASALNYRDIAEILLSHGANVNALDKNGESSLHLALRNGARETVELLLMNGADPNIIFEKGRSSIHEASINNMIKTIELMLTKGINIDAKDEDGKTALHYATIYHKRKIVEFLVSHGADVKARDNDNKTVLHFAAIYDRNEEAEFLLSCGLDVNAVDDSGKTALHYASENGMKTTAELLILHGADVNANDDSKNTAIYYAAQNGHSDIVKLLVSSGADANQKFMYMNISVLHIASGLNDTALAEFLLSHDADVNTKDILGRSPIWYAIGIDDYYDYQKELPDIEGIIELANILISHGAEVNENDIYGLTLLHHAAGYPKKDIAEFLIMHGSDVNAIGKQNNTALHIAAKHQNVDLVRMLILNGADPYIKNINGLTPIDIAEKMKIKQFIDELIHPKEDH
ncbi:ankyrin repeat protein, putative [Trichomonas vaginalis G3]|uniref:Ankyrin repeat protein, putative n=1 Tax=Trichomonas vaginalis (strain ATCC PRA-98 / G3) TaxID=412133 RepID=A2DWC2_TRIV3|nr:ankyrin repeat and SOCS box-containing protein 4 family [Trichomonas vaginalis G3]EAY15262.1 ankyrin repeat protein, putative [Trichomonas vaginalis G3]KAI5526424.1 ankyrin repeat and SOCS box-containing protein 4 family [Trichomonas vaginalis G3]|eukprot:XP_001327485.1 ankyrin repeat protein [Trichomonas vaginalis G3]